MTIPAEADLQRVAGRIRAAAHPARGRRDSRLPARVLTTPRRPARPAGAADWTDLDLEGQSFSLVSWRRLDRRGDVVETGFDLNGYAVTSRGGRRARTMEIRSGAVVADTGWNPVPDLEPDEDPEPADQDPWGGG